MYFIMHYLYFAILTDLLNKVRTELKAKQLNIFPRQYYKVVSEDTELKTKRKLKIKS